MTATEKWIENKGRAPKDPNEKRYIQYRNGTFARDPDTMTIAPVRVGAYRWTLNDRNHGGRSGSPFDIWRSRKP